MIILDASTLILLAKAELLTVFLEAVRDEAGEEVAIPKEVEKECCGAPYSPDALWIRAAIEEKKIRGIGLKNRKVVETVLLHFSLGKGEAEAIALAVAENAALVAIDDKQGINACKFLGIPFTTAIAILVRIREKGRIERDEALNKLELLVKFGRYRAEIVEQGRAALEGRK